MKNIKTTGVLLFLFILLHSCMGSINGKKIKGNGNVVKTTRPVQSFNKLKIEGIFNVYIDQGEVEKVVVETDENLQPYVITESKNGQLLLSWKDEVNLKKSSKMRVYVTLRNIDALVIDGIGKVETTTGLRLDELKLAISGVGKTDLELELDKLVASIDAVGKVRLKGMATNASIEASGVGKLDARDFECKRLILENSGVGAISVNATQFLHIETDGIGSVRYTGDPEIKEISASGIGKVTEL